MNKWVLDKTKALGELFVASGAMDADQFKLLDALVDNMSKSTMAMLGKVCSNLVQLIPM